MMVALLLYSYALGERSSRRNERRCFEHVAHAGDQVRPRSIGQRARTASKVRR
jgi:hypothetical protein